MITRRELMVWASAALLTPPRVRAQAAKAAVVGLLWNDTVKPSPHAATLVGALRELGWTSSRNLQLKDYVALEGYAPMAESAAALVREHCDVIVTYGATATLAVAKATKDIPVAMLIGVDPVRLGLVASLSRPGGNVTGVTNLSQGLIAKRLELLRELSAGSTAVGVLIAAGELAQASLTQVTQETQAAAAALKMTPTFAHVRAPEDIDAAVSTFAASGLRSVYVSQGTFLAAHRARIVRLLGERRLVAIYPSDAFVEAGGLLAYAPSVRKAFVRLGSYVDRLLRGARPADTPIEQLSEVELVINLKTAKAQGLKIPPSILQRTDRVIE